MLNIKKTLIWLLAVLMALTAVGCKPSDSSSATEPEKLPHPLAEQYPAFFDLDTSKGLTLYVAKYSQTYTSCALYATTEAEADYLSIAMGPQANTDAMQQILADYNLPAEAITVVPYYSPLSSYIAPDLFEEQGLQELLYQLGLREKPEQVPEEPDDAPFPTTLSWADNSEAGEHALRYTYYPITGSYAYQNELTYPAIGIKNTQELDSFLILARSYFSLSASMPDKETFNEVVKKYDEAFFAEKGLVIVYIPSESTSIGYKLTDAALAGEELHVTVAESRPEGELASQAAGWFMTVELPQEIISQANYFSAGK